MEPKVSSKKPKGQPFASTATACSLCIAPLLPTSSSGRMMIPFSAGYERISVRLSHVANKFSGRVRPWRSFRLTEMDHLMADPLYRIELAQGSERQRLFRDILERQGM